jgi:hypothetical protein
VAGISGLAGDELAHSPSLPALAIAFYDVHGFSVCKVKRAGPIGGGRGRDTLEYDQAKPTSAKRP